MPKPLVLTVFQLGRRLAPLLLASSFPTCLVAAGLAEDVESGTGTTSGIRRRLYSPTAAPIKPADPQRATTSTNFFALDPKADLFVHIDVNGDGVLDRSEIQQYFDTLPPTTTFYGTKQSVTVTELLAREDLDGDGMISQEEFTGPGGGHRPMPADDASGIGADANSSNVFDHNNQNRRNLESRGIIRELHHTSDPCVHQDTLDVPKHRTSNLGDNTEEAAGDGKDAYVQIAGVRVGRDETKYFYSCHHRNAYQPEHGLKFHMDKGWNYLRVHVSWEESFWGDSMRVYYGAWEWYDISRNPPEDGIPVKIEQQGVGDALCLEVGENGRVGVNVNLHFSKCQDPVEKPKHADAQTFLLKFDVGSSAFALRPKRSVESGYNVCVPEMEASPLKTQDCETTANKFIIINNSIRSANVNSDLCIVNQNNAAISTCADVSDQQKTKLQIKADGADFAFRLNGRLNLLDDPLSYKFAGTVTYPTPNSNAIFLYGGEGLNIKGADWKKFEFGSTRFLINENSLFEFDFSVSNSNTNLIAICLVTATTAGPGCLVVHNEFGGSEVVVPPTSGKHYKYQLGGHAGSEISALAFVQGDSSHLLGSSSFSNMVLLDTVDIVRYAGCYSGAESALPREMIQSSYDACHKACFDGGFSHFRRSNEGKCHCGNPPPQSSLGTAARDCACSSSSNIGSNSCIYSVGPIISETGKLQINQNGDQLTLTEVSSSQRDAGFVSNGPESKSIIIKGHKYVRFPLSMNITSETILEFDFSSSKEAQQHGVCIVEGDNDLHCKYILGTRNELETNTNGAYASPNGQKSSYRIKVGEEGRTYMSSGLVFLQDNSEASETQTLRSGQSLYENVMVYSLMGSTVTSRTKDAIEIEVDRAADIPDGIFFKAEVLVQDENGVYSKVPAAEKAASRMAPTSVRIPNLSYGKRYSITLLPVDNKGNAVAREQRHNKAIAITTTTCSCTTDLTGTPTNMQVSQLNGIISVQYNDNSVCEDAFGFSRKDVETDEIDSYAPNYLFYSTEECSATEVVQPPVAYADYIARSNLVVGKDYEYCVRAVAKDYMVKTTVDTGELVTSSDPVCENHTVRWEASVKVQIQLRKDAGSLPVQDAVVTYHLMNPDNHDIILKTNNITTPESGTVLIALSELTLNGHTMDETKQYPIKISVAKNTDNVEHEFLCDDEAVVCPDDGVTVYLSHLDFDVGIVIADSTSLKVEGKVTIGWQGYEDSGCPLQNAQVCLFRKQSGVIGGVDSEDVCVKTDMNGVYQLPATIGTRVYPKVVHAQHNFVYLDPNNGVDFDRTTTTESTGFLVTVSGEVAGAYRNHNFLDTNTTSLIVQVAGGSPKCNIGLGSSVIKVKICSGRDEGEKTFPASSDVISILEVPAQKVEVRVDSITGRGDFITEEATVGGFFGKYELLDLSEVDQITENDEAMSKNGENNRIVNANPAGSSKGDAAGSTITKEEEAVAEDANAVRTARFQYNGRLIIDAAMEPDSVGPCLSPTRTTVESTSHHVIAAREIFDVTVNLRYLIFQAEGDQSDVYCDDVSGEKVSLLSTVGLVQSDPRDNALLTLLRQTGTGEEDLNLYRACTVSECILDIAPPDEVGTDQRSTVVQRLKAGQPKKSAPFESTITIQALGKPQRHTMYIVTTGDYKAGNGKVFPMPTHRPLLVLRDPPGGESFAHYENVQTSVKITMDNYERYDGVDGGVGLTVGPQADIEACAGLGASVCNKMLKLNANVGGEIGLGSQFLGDFRDDTRSHGFTVTWTYSTTAEQIYAGSEGDTFLVPTISILYIPTVTVFFNATTCKASDSTSIKFDLAAPENKRTMTFLNKRHVDTELLPRLRQDLSNLDLNDINYEASSSSLQASIDTWDSFLTEYRAVNARAAAGDLDNVGSWYSKHGTEKRPTCKKRTKTYDYTIYSEYMCDPGTEPNIQKLYGDSSIPDRPADGTTPWTDIEESHPYWDDWAFYHPSVESPNTPLAPNALLEEAVLVDATAEYFESSSTLESTGRIFYSGGGSSVGFTLSSEKMSELQGKWDAADLGQNSNIQLAAGVEGEMGLTAASFGIDLDMYAGYTLETSHTMLTENDSGLETSISFELYDPDEGDEFLIDVFLDPKYGTFVFHTVTGRSMCPHESNTDPVEVPMLEVVSPIRFVQEDEAMVFNVTLWNNGIGPNDFALYLENMDNSMGLDISFAEDYLQLTTERVKAEVIVTRGPLAYDYDSVRLTLQSTCELDASLGRSFGGQTQQKATSELFNKVEQVTLSNGTITTKRSISFIEPCLGVQFAGDIKYKDTFTVKSGDGPNLPVRIYNPDSSKRTMANAPRVQKVELEYRRVGDLNWLSAQNSNDDGETVDIDFSETGLEDPYGFSEADWKLPTEESEYQIRLKTTCTEGGSPEVNWATTDIITGVIDRTLPAVYGHPEPQVNWVPGEELIVQFTEDIFCAMPYRFDAMVSVDGIGIFDMGASDIDVRCSGNTISIQLKQESGGYDQFLGRGFTLTITDVDDISRNRLEMYTYKSNFICRPPEPALSIVHPAGSRPYLPDESIEFEATLSNNGRALSYAELGIDLRTNAADFEVLVNGASALVQEYTLDAAETITTTISIRKGPGKELKFMPITVFLRSSCDADGHNPVTVNADLYNYQDQASDTWIAFTSPCPAIRWADPYHTRPTFVLNADTLGGSKNLMEVSIRNEDYKNRNLYDRLTTNADAGWSSRLEDVVLLYRKVGDKEWSLGTTKTDAGTISNFASQGVEDAFGFATLFWDLDLDDVVDSEYEVRIASRCTALPYSPHHDELTEYSTSSILGIIDRLRPQVFGIPKLELPPEIHPSSHFVISFTEPLHCKEPFTFDLELLVELSDGTSTTLRDKEGIHVKCEVDSILFRFDSNRFDGDAYASLFGSTISLSLSNVEDTARNIMLAPYETTYASCNTEYVRSHEVFQMMGCNGRDDDCNFVIDDCPEDLIPPKLWFNSSLASSIHPDYPDAVLINDAAFKNVEDARSFLFKNVMYSDDCAKELDIEVSIPEAACSVTIFTVVVSDPRCSDVNPVQTVSQDFILHIDGESPIVSVGFEKKRDADHFDAQNLYLHTNEVDMNIWNTLFHYSVDDNCHQKIKVDISIFCNQNEPLQDIAAVTRRADLHQSRQSQVYIKPQVCDGLYQSNSGSLCETDLVSTDQSAPSVRFYEIVVTATDFAGNVGFNNATVLVIPALHTELPRDHDPEHYILDAWGDKSRHHIVKFQTEFDTTIPSSPIQILASAPGRGNGGGSDGGTSGGTRPGRGG